MGTIRDDDILIHDDYMNVTAYSPNSANSVRLIVDDINEVVYHPFGKNFWGTKMFFVIPFNRYLKRKDK